MKKTLCMLISLFLMLTAVVPAWADGQPQLPIRFAPEGLEVIEKRAESDPAAACDHVGTVECMKYTSSDGSVKAALVYLPYGYEESDDRYDVLYLLHGSGGSAKSYLDPDETTAFQREMDLMIKSGEIAPLIVVAPALYPASVDPADYQAVYKMAETISGAYPDISDADLWLSLQVQMVSAFPQELVKDVIPAVEAKYRTDAESVDLEGIRASRDHRAVGGFSLGGVATWYVLLQEMQAFRYYLPLCEASWDDGQGWITCILDGALSAQVIYDAVKAQGYTAEDFYLYAATGTKDEALMYLSRQMRSLLRYSDLFLFGENTTYCICIGGEHCVSDALAYIFNGLTKFWKDA